MCEKGVVSGQRYKYLFPYEKVEKGSKIIIYGAGALGQDYYQQILITNYCNVVGFIDKNYDKYCDSIVPVYSPEKIPQLEFDYVVVALRMASSYNEIRRILLSYKILEEKIVAVFERQYEEISILGKDKCECENLAFNKTKYSIAILATGGIGDMVIQKRLILEMIKLVPECIIDIYNIKAIDFLECLYTDMPQVNTIIGDLGCRFSRNYLDYSLALTIEACHFIHVNSFIEENWSDEYNEFTNKVKLLIARTEEENVGISTPVHVTMYRKWFGGNNAYTGFNYNGVFNISDKKVNIPIDDNEKSRFEKLSLGNYITINCGNGDCHDGNLVAKSWPTTYYDQLVKMLKGSLKKINIVQLGYENSHRIQGCDKYILGENFSLVEHILKNSLLHIDIEGGLVHIASQIGTKCVVLFGPTVVEYYGYENNINIRVGNCHNCCGLYTDVNKCARNMKKPECMYSITPDIVYEKVSEYFNNMT